MFGMKKKDINQLEMQELMDVAEGAKRVEEACHNLGLILEEIISNPKTRTEEKHHEIEKILEFIEKNLEREIESLHEAKNSEKKSKIIKIET